MNQYGDCTGSSESVLLHLCLPHEPQLEGVHMASALEALVSSIVAHVIRLVLLEEVVRPQAVAFLQETLHRRQQPGGGGGAHYYSTVPPNLFSHCECYSEVLPSS